MKTDGHERGSVTAELALTLPAVVVALLAVLAAAAIGTAQVRCIDGARAGARAAAMGQDVATVTSLAVQSAGAGTTAAVSVLGSGLAQVTVSRELALPWGGSLLLSASAAAPIEPEGG